MSYLSFLIAFIKFRGLDTSRMNFSEGRDLYLDIVVGIEWTFFKISLVVFALVVAALVFLRLTGRLSVNDDLGWGCAVFLLFATLAILEYVTWLIANMMADSVSTAGITDPTKFWGFVILMVLLGLG